MLVVSQPIPMPFLVTHLSDQTVSFGTTEETPEKHVHFKSRAKYLVTSVDKDQLSILEETSAKTCIEMTKTLH